MGHLTGTGTARVIETLEFPAPFNFSPKAAQTLNYAQTRSSSCGSSLRTSKDDRRLAYAIRRIKETFYKTTKRIDYMLNATPSSHLLLI